MYNHLTLFIFYHKTIFKRKQEIYLWYLYVYLKFVLHGLMIIAMQDNFKLHGICYC